jgi:glycosyltransferase involved in cell wall biosynthesis
MITETMTKTAQIHITIATGLYAPDIGGPATYALTLEDELPKRGLPVQIVPFGWVRHYPKIIRHFVYAYKLWQETKTTDVIYALDPISVGLPALCVARLRRKPFMIRLGGDYAWEQGRNRFGVTATLDEYLLPTTKKPFPVRVLAWLQAFVTKRAVSVVAPSEYLKSVIVTWGVPADKIMVIYSALFPIEVPSSREELRTQFQFTGPTLVTAGRLVPWKGFSALLRVVAKLKETHPAITLVIAGDGPLEKTLKAEAETLTLGTAVRFVGRVSKEALGASIKAADVFVLNTAYEGLSHQLIEVMDIGTPIVTTPAGGNTELITDTVNGFLVPFDDEASMVDAISRLLHHPETRTRMVQSARARAKDFSHEAMMEALIQLIRQVYEK